MGVWAKGLLIQTGSVLLDREMDHPVVAEIREAVETVDTGGGSTKAGSPIFMSGGWGGLPMPAVSLLTHDRSLTPARVRERLAQHEEIVHATIEIQQCEDCALPAEPLG